MDMSASPPNRASVSAHIERDAVQIIECTVPAEMTLEEWRQSRPRVDRRRLRMRRARNRTPQAAPRLTLVPDAPCDHFHDTTSRYDHAEKRLTFLLVCHECQTERVVETVPYEPRFEPHRQQLAA
jgi:hypothetical protein